MIHIKHFDAITWGITSYKYKYSPGLHREAKATPGMRWAPHWQAWIGWPDAVAVCAKRLEAASIIVHGELPPPPGEIPIPSHEGQFLHGLRGYQKQGVRFLAGNAGTGALLADDMGLGKTAQALRSIGMLGQSALVVCPSFVRHVWSREAAKWLPKASVFELTGTKPDNVILPTNAIHVYLIHYDIVHAWVKRLADIAPGVCVFDECHFLMSEKSRRSQACRQLARHARYRIGLSGTPMTSRPRDLWNVVDTLSEGRFGRPFDFFLAHCDAHKETVTTRQGDKVVWNTDGASNLDELHERLSYFMLRRTKTDVALELPPRTRQVIEVEVPRLVRMPVGDALKSDRQLREALALAADGKLPRAIELIANHVAQGSKVVMFSHRKVVAEIVAASLKSQGVASRVITGEVPHVRRVAIVDEQPDVLCATLDSTSVGIDLSFADIAVFVELDWVPSKLSQGESRLHRFGQKRNVLIQYIIALSTVDEVIAETVVAKLDVFEQAVGKTDDGLRKSLAGIEVSSAEQLKKLYAKIKSLEI